MRRRAPLPRLPWLLALAALAPGRAWAHPGLPPEPHDLASAWTLDPWVAVPLLVSGWLYARGTERMWRRSGAGRGVRRWEAGCFAAGWLVLAAAMVSPLHALGEALFSAHMAQHVLLMAVAAPLLVLGRPVVPFLWGVPPAWRRQLGGWARGRAVRAAWGALTAVSAAWLLHAAAIWLWHLPALYQATLASEGVHALQHLSFLGTALLFWWALVHGRRGRTGYGGALLALFTTALHGGGLGALLTFSPRPWYPAYAEAGAPWGLTPLEDQQLAGLIMWIPAGVAYLVAALLLLAGWMRESERRTARWEERGALRPT